MNMIVHVDLESDEPIVEVLEYPNNDRLETQCLLQELVTTKLKNYRRFGNPYDYGLVVQQDKSLAVRKHSENKLVQLFKQIEIKGEII